MADVTIELLRTHFRQLRLPTMGQEFERLAREAAATNETFDQFLLGLTELEVEARAANAVATRIKNAEFPVLKDFDTFDFTAAAAAEQAEGAGAGRGEWIEHKHNCCLDRQPGHGKDAPGHGLGPGGVPAGQRVRLLHGGGVGQQLEEAQKQYPLDRFLGQLDERSSADLRRAGLPVVQPAAARAAVPGVRRPLRAAQPAGDEQPAVQRMGPDLPGRADDGGAFWTA